MSTWEPSDNDVQWLVNLLDSLKVGGVWIAPSYGVIFNKVDENTLKLGQPLILTLEAVTMIERTMKVAEQAGIYIEKPGAMIILPPTPFMHKTQNYTCELCGTPIADGKEVRLEDGDTIICRQCSTDDSGQIRPEETGT